MFSDVIVLHGLDNFNAKGKDLLFILKSIKFRVLPTYFKHSNYTTWRYFNSNRSSHMLDNFICSQPFFRKVKYCKVVNIGMHSNHTAILTTFKIIAIEFKLTEKKVAQNNWKLIGYHNMTSEIFNNSLSIFIDVSIKYPNFNKNIL